MGPIVFSYDTRPRSASLLAKTKAIKGQTCVAAVVEVGLKILVVVASSILSVITVSK